MTAAAETMREAERAFEAFLDKRGLKLTNQRRGILREAVSASGHFSAEQLLELSRKRDATASKATVYRTLALLKESGVIEEQDFGDGRKVYERAQGRKHHDHLVCVRCGRIIEFENDRIEALQDEEAGRHGFHVIYHSLKLFGTCRDCRPA